MAEIQQPEDPEASQNQSSPAPKNVDLNIGGDVGGNAIVGDHNYVVNNYYPAIENNIENHEPDFWALKHPYPMPKNFTGRIAERATLTHWLKEDSENCLFILRALGGFGKSALTWQWLTHDVDPKEYPKVVFWSFYEGDASFEHFIEETLKYLKLEVPQGQRPQVDELLKAMHAPAQKILLIMDGFERALRAYSSMNAAYQGDEEPKLDENQYDCVNINAQIFLQKVCSLPNITSKVLMTTRLTPRAVKTHDELLQGCFEKELKEMDKADAVAFYYAQGIQGTRNEIEAACVSYGYHPLSLRILAGLITNDREKPGNVVFAKDLDITENVIQNQHHVLEVAYNSLSIEEQKLLSYISCFRSPTNYQTIKAIYGIPSRKRKNTKTKLKINLNELLNKLENCGLLQWDRKANKYDIHPIVRKYAYARLNKSDRIKTHTQLRNYFISEIEIPDKTKTINEITPIIELYHHTVQAGELYAAAELYRDRLQRPLYYQQGKYEVCIQILRTLFIDGEDKVPEFNNVSARGWVMHELASSYSMNGQPHSAALLYEAAIKLDETQTRNREGKLNLSVGLGAIGSAVYFPIGRLQNAEINYKRAIDLCKEIKDNFQEAAGHVELGLLSIFLGDWDTSLYELETAKKVFDSRGYKLTNSVSLVRSYLAQFHMLQKNISLSIEFAKEALDLAKHPERSPFSGERDIILAHWLLGAVYRLDKQITFAEFHLSEALTRTREINFIQSEANILLDLARLRYDQKNYEEAESLADEALIITERCGYVLQGADVNLFLAQYALEQEKDKAKAKEYAETALKLAYCDGPPYYYKVAYEEAERMLAGL